ncbi:uncharacterized protein [Coffea arabica]|uniref:Reverse transcriptase domain-containing protein n=2 Tax=Coffea arabica TaxID=13443 RepID=A0A6P6UHS7_COFAR
MPWLLMGDFNVIAQVEEKRGGLPVRPEEGGELLNFMSSAGVGDAGFTGSRFTWCNNRQERARIWKRLDRVLLNDLAVHSEHGFGVQHLGRDPSDHAPLLISAVTRLDNKPKPFRFLNVWTKNTGLLDVIAESWGQPMSGSPLRVLSEKLRVVKQALRAWSKTEFGDIFVAVRQAEKAVMEAEEDYDHHPSDAKWVRLQEARARLRNNLTIEEGFWKQKARVKWAVEGDKNSKYFHDIVAEKRRKAIIHRIRKANGEWVDSEGQIGCEAVSFFQDLFTAEASVQPQDFLRVIPRLVSEQDNLMLTEAPTLHEVKEVIFSMDGESAAGPDGFTGKFFTFAWEVVAADVYAGVVSFFCGAELPRGVAATSIVLIPKVQCPQDFSQFRPISLCNFINKIISKVLADRLARILPQIISPQQSGFVQGRLISDSFLLAQELVTDMKRGNRGGNVILKLDMMKAYDRVSWPFLLQVMRRFGFSETWIDMIWRLISNVWFSVIVNGLPQGFFKATRGLRQGDPISPALFVIGAEVLSRDLNELPGRRNFNPFKVPVGCPAITHLAYADDVIVFTSGLKLSLQMVMGALEEYCAVSGQKINHQKSCFLVHPRLQSQRRILIGQLTGFRQRNFPIKYLGCPLYVGRMKKEYYADIVHSVTCKILSWKHRTLSSGGRIVLIKSVLASMPIHLLAAAYPPKGVLRELEKIFANFLWGSSDWGPKFHWLSWVDLCQPYNEGGIGIRRLNEIFDAFSVKLWWLFRQKRSLWAEFMWAKYCGNLHPCLAEAGPRGSATWRRMRSVQRVADEHIAWIVREGMMDFWHDNWLGTGALCQTVDVFLEHRVQDFVDDQGWKARELRQVLEPGLMQRVLDTRPPDMNGCDSMVWSLTNTGKFTVSSAYAVIRQENNRSWLASYVWHKSLPFKISFFMLRLLSSKLPLQECLRRLGIQGPSRCCCCGSPQTEGLDHVFCTGDLAMQVWGYFETQAVDSSVCTTRHRVLRWWLRPSNNRFLRYIFRFVPSLICWELWRARNSAVFEGRGAGCEGVVRKVLQHLGDLFHGQFPGVRVSFLSWRECCDFLVRQQRQFAVVPVSWVAPGGGCKINSDGCSKGNPGLSGGGGVLRDEQGNFLVGYSCFFGRLTSLHPELKALLFGVRLCLERGYTDLHIEADSLVLINMVQGIYACPWRLQQDMEELMTYRPHFRGISHCYREVNRPADTLANIGVELMRDCIFDSFAMLPKMARGNIRMDRLGLPSFRARLR